MQWWKKRLFHLVDWKMIHHYQLTSVDVVDAVVVEEVVKEEMEKPSDVSVVVDVADDDLILNEAPANSAACFINKQFSQFFLDVEYCRRITETRSADRYTICTGKNHL